MYCKHGFILYFDIMGYKSIVNGSDNGSDERFKYILDLYSEKQGKLNFSFVFSNEYIKNKDRLLMRCFSDNFLFLYENRPFSECTTQVTKANYYQTLSSMIGVAQMIQSQFLEQGILTRGSITFGELFYNSKIIYGKSLINAVVLEEGHPEPSIVLDPVFSSIANQNEFTYTPFVNPFMYHRNSEADHYAIVGGVKKYLQSLSLDDCSQEEKDHILYKINWMIDRMNEHFQYSGSKQYYLEGKRLKERIVQQRE